MKKDNFKEKEYEVFMNQLKDDDDPTKLSGKEEAEKYGIKIGDIVTDHYHTIKVESIDYFYDCFLGGPTAKLKGPDYKKDGTISKRQTNMPVYLQNIKGN